MIILYLALALTLPSGYSYQVSEGSWFLDCHVGQHLAIDFDPRFLQASHELAIGKPMSPAGGVDPQYPQASHIPLPLTAVEISVSQ